LYYYQLRTTSYGHAQLVLLVSTFLHRLHTCVDVCAESSQAAIQKPLQGLGVRQSSDHFLATPDTPLRSRCPVRQKSFCVGHKRRTTLQGKPLASYWKIAPPVETLPVC
jgi:hypothetical protein